MCYEKNFFQKNVVHLFIIFYFDTKTLYLQGSLLYTFPREVINWKELCMYTCVLRDGAQKVSSYKGIFI